MIFYMGIDPGWSGAVALISEGGTVVEFANFGKMTPTDVSLFIREQKNRVALCTIEQVCGRPTIVEVDGKKEVRNPSLKSVNNFMECYGMLQGFVIAHGIPLHKVIPMKWQKYMGCLTRGDKNVSKRKAQELFPLVDITHANADALLIAEYGRRINLLFGLG